MTRQKILIDTDPGIDDALALLYLHRHPAVDLIGITTVFGNAPVEMTTRNAQFLAQAWGIETAIRAGAASPLTPSAAPFRYPTHIHGANGLGDYPIIGSPQKVVDTAARFIVDTVRAFPGEVRILAVAHLTNLARALEIDPEITGLVRDVVIMGGAFETHGNKSPAAEANIYGDPLAADRVVAADWPTTMVPLNLTRQTIMTRADLAELAIASDEARMIAEISNGYFGFYERSGLPGMLVHDCSAAVYLTNPELFTKRCGPIVVVETGPAAGLTVQKPEGLGFGPSEWDRRPVHDICMGGDADEILARIKATLRQKNN